MVRETVPEAGWATPYIAGELPYGEGSASSPHQSIQLRASSAPDGVFPFRYRTESVPMRPVDVIGLEGSQALHVRQCTADNGPDRDSSLLRAGRSRSLSCHRFHPSTPLGRTLGGGQLVPTGETSPDWTRRERGVCHGHPVRGPAPPVFVSPDATDGSGLRG